MIAQTHTHVYRSHGINVLIKVLMSFRHHTEHRVVTLEDSLNALATVSKVRTLTHNDLLERIHVLGQQQQELEKVFDAEKERFRKRIETSTITIYQLNSEIERLNVEKSEAEERSREMARIQQLAEERTKNMTALKIQVKEHSIKREVMEAGKNFTFSDSPSTSAYFYKVNSMFWLTFRARYTELRNVKLQQGLVVLQLQQSSAGKTSESDSFIRIMTSLEMSFDCFLQEIEGTLHKVHIRGVLANEELNEKGRITKVLKSEIDQLNAERTGKLAAYEQLSSLQSLMRSLNRKIVELEEGNTELQSRLKDQRTADSNNTVMEQHLQVQISVLQGLQETRHAEQAGLESCIGLLEARNEQLLSDAQSAQNQLTELQSSCEVKEREYQQEVKVLTQQIVDQEISHKSMLEENNGLRKEVSTIKQDFNSAFFATAERERIIKGQLEDITAEREYLHQLYGLRNTEIERMHGELDIFRSNEEMKLKLATPDIFRHEKEEASLKNVLKLKDEEIERMETGVNELKDAMRDLMVELQSERHEQATKREAAVADMSRLENEDAGLHASLEQTMQENRRLQALADKLEKSVREAEKVPNLLELLDAKAKELFDLTRANMLAESRVSELQRTVADAMASETKNSKIVEELQAELYEANQQLQRGNSELDGVNAQLEVAKTDLRNLQDTVDRKAAELNKLRHKWEKFQAPLAEKVEMGGITELKRLELKDTDLKELMESLDQEDGELNAMTHQNANLQTSLEKLMAEVGDSAAILEVKDTDLKKLKESLDRKDGELINLPHEKESLVKQLSGLKAEVRESAALKESLEMKGTDLSELRQVKENLQAKDEELRETVEDLNTTKMLLADMQQRIMHAEAELNVVQTLQNESKAKVSADDTFFSTLKAEKEQIQREKAVLMGDLQTTTEFLKALTNELRDTQAALFDSQVACNRFELKCAAYAKEIDALQRGVATFKMPNGRTGSQVSCTKTSRSLSPTSPESVVPVPESSRQASPDIEGQLENEELRQQDAIQLGDRPRATRSAAPKAPRSSATDTPRAPPPSSFATPRSMASRPGSLQSEPPSRPRSTQSDPPPAISQAPLPPPTPPSEQVSMLTPGSSPPKEIQGDASTTDQVGGQTRQPRAVEIKSLSASPFVDEQMPEFISEATIHAISGSSMSSRPGLIRTREILFGHDGLERSAPIMSMGPRPPAREASASVKNWMSSVFTPIQQPQAQERDQGALKRDTAGIGVVLTEEMHERLGSPSIVVLDLIPGMPAHLDSNIQVFARFLLAKAAIC